MPHQEHLPQAGRQLAHRSRVPGTAAWLAALIGALLLFLAAGTASAQAAATPALHAEAVRAANWHDTAPPADGWTPVTLPDSWAQRWPGFDGVVWYRLTWTQPEPEHVQEAGLLLRYLNMAGEVSLNGTPISRDESLVEPLTRAWNTPRYWLLAAPLLRPGANTLLVRVSGLAAYQAGLGPVELGTPQAMQAAFGRERLLRHDLQVLGLAVSAAVSAFFAAWWWLRRRETAYGWFAAMSVLWLLFAYNQIATSPWPFASNHGWQALNTSLLLVFSLSYLVFALRYAGQRKPRLEGGALLVVAAGVADLWLAPLADLMAHRALWTLVGGLTIIVVNSVAIVHAWRHRGSPMRTLAPFMALSAITGAHDLLVFTQVIDSNIYYTNMSSYVLLLGMALAQAARFAQSLRRIENFNTELIEEVNAAKAELAATLQQQHALEVAHARIGERVNLVSDLHDGLGGTLVGSIATLEREPEKAGRARAAGHAQAPARRPAPDHRRHRPRRRRARRWASCWRPCATAARSCWRPTASLPLDRHEHRHARAAPSQSLDLMRFLQEALTNVLKHSASARVDVSVARAGAELRLSVRDDGRGFAVEDAGRADGAGLRNLRARARRLGAELQLQSRPGDTQVALRMPLAP
jgi:signal transduction histidine kinase